MSNDRNQEGYQEAERSKKLALQTSGALQVGLIAAASAIAGGLAVAWWHRNTLAKLQNPIQTDFLPNPEFLEMEEIDTE